MNIKISQKNLWQTSKSLGMSSHSQTKPGSIGLGIDNNTCLDKAKVTEHFNHFLTTTASTLVNKLPFSDGKYGWHHIQNYYTSLNAPVNCFKLSEVTEDMVLRILCKLNPSKVTGV